MLWQIISLIVLLFLSGLFSGSEVALVSLSKIQLRTLLKQKRKGSKAVEKLKDNPQRMIITILIGNNLVNIGASVLATLVATDLFGSSGAGIAIGAMTFLVLVFGEITPKSYAATHADKVSLIMGEPLWILSRILYPLVKLFEWITHSTLVLFGVSKKVAETMTEDDLKTAIDIGAEEKSIEQDEKELLKKVFEFNDITAKEVMTRRHNMFCLDANMKVKDAIEAIADSPFSRTPLFLGSLDNIVGVVHTKDVLEAITDDEEDLPLREIGVKPFFIHEKTIIDDLFKMFQERHTHIALVVGEDGKTVGLVTIEDLLEELVGEIIDESDVTPNKIMRVDKNIILVDGETSPKYVNSFFQTDLDTKHDTVSDLLIDEFKKVPPRGQEIKINNHIYFIEEVGEEHIERIKVRKHK
ncbi:HlyC/CorC family transporter [Candidatus Woesearchaeota archaeon]|nr:HlyC/CorC family transporter [Candidatus Woesearchaeota archaeon]